MRCCLRVSWPHESEQKEGEKRPPKLRLHRKAEASSPAANNCQTFRRYTEDYSRACLGPSQCTYSKVDTVTAASLQA